MEDKTDVEARGKKQEARGKRQEVRSKRQEVRSKRQEARGKKQEVRSKKQEARSKNMNKSEIKKILVVAPNWIGDAVMALPAISRIRDRFPAARITLLAPPHIAELFLQSPYIDETKVYHERSQKSGVAAGFSLRSEKFDLSILFPNSFRSALIVRLAGIPLRAGYNRDGRGFLLNIPVSFNSKAKGFHQVEYYLNLVAVLSAAFSNVAGQECPAYRDRRGFLTPPYEAKWLYVSQEEKDQAFNFLRQNQIFPDDLIIGINPGAAYGSSKRWYPERFGLVARALITQYNIKVIVFGGNKEVDIAEEITKRADSPLVNMAGRTSVRELMALIGHCRLFITNDSGPMHIAAALGVPVVAIFGSTDPQLTGPSWTEHVIIKKDVPCSPCFLRKCPTDLRCMDLVSVDDVLEGVEKIWK